MSLPLLGTLDAATLSLPLLVIVVIFTVTLGRRTLGERESRLLKLLSGLMMLGPGAVLGLTLATTWLIYRITQSRAKHS